MAEAVQNQSAGPKDFTGPAQTWNNNKHDKHGQNIKLDIYLDMILNCHEIILLENDTFFLFFR